MMMIKRGVSKKKLCKNSHGRPWRSPNLSSDLLTVELSTREKKKRKQEKQTPWAMFDMWVSHFVRRPEKDIDWSSPLSSRFFSSVLGISTLLGFKKKEYYTIIIKNNLLKMDGSYILVEEVLRYADRWSKCNPISEQLQAQKFKIIKLYKMQ